MKNFLFSLAILLSSLTGFTQEVRHISRSGTADSSFYDMVKLSNGSIWLAGEYGILKRFEGETLIQVDYPNTGANILRIAELGDYLFLAADHGTVYRLHKPSNTWKVKQFVDYRNQCFYDMMTDADGKLWLCGGSSGIGKGKMRIPRGFVVRLDTSLNHEPSPIWSSFRQFAWTLTRDDQEQVVFSVFNGLNSRLFKTNTSGKLQKAGKIKGLVHSLSLLDGRLVYGGCVGLRYKRKGMWGYADSPQTRKVIRQAGFISNIIEHDQQLIAFSQQGQVWVLKPDNNVLLWSGSSGSLYEGLSSNGLLWLAGHGKTFLSLQ
jgi:hypothetical protein